MNIQQVTLTNQKLTAAKMHLKCISRLSTDAPAVLLNTYRESVVFQLCLACRLFVKEMALDHQLSSFEGDSFSLLKAALEENSLSCSQCSELALLQKSQGSWLFWLFDRYEQCWDTLVSQVSVDKGFDKTKASVDLIALKSLDELSVEDRLLNCIEQLQRIIAEYRELMQQW